MSFCEKSKWIWINNEKEKNVYGEFYSELDYQGGELGLRISADSNYTVFINGKFVESDQYPDFPHYKVYDEFDITPYLIKGSNKLAIIVWHYGEINMSYYPHNAALRFEVFGGDDVVLCSDENILSRKSIAYKNHMEKLITNQIGYSFWYDATKEDNWVMGELDGFKKSVIVDQDLPLSKRVIKKLVVEEPVKETLIKEDKNYFLYDLGREEVGYLSIKVKSPKAQTLTICWGEHIKDGGVRSQIGGRDFSVQVTVGEGVTEYKNYFRRFGLRYLEVHTEGDVEIERMTVMPCHYPLKKIDKKLSNPIYQKIYDLSVRTLELCVHDHYEDCPWREQALYAMDSRNQMLCGYYAFGETGIPRDNLYLISKDNREDGFLSICIPTKLDLIIPSFSLHYFTEVYEYTVETKDLTLAKEVLPKLLSIVDSFKALIKDGIIRNKEAEGYWHFYEWVNDLSGQKFQSEDLCINALFSMALDKLQKLSDMLGIEADYKSLIDQINEGINKEFFDRESGLYKNAKDDDKDYILVNSLAILCGAAKGEVAENICENIVNNEKMIKTSLSMIGFEYDALLMINKDKYKDFILKDIEVKYTHMLNEDATAVWETEDGEFDFDAAGSLCHGWSAMPVYYFNMLLD